MFLVFEDTENTRTQEFIVRWSPDIDGSFQEIVRQQWNFSPPDSVRETEDYRVELLAVKVFELMIVPYKSGREVQPSLPLSCSGSISREDAATTSHGPNPDPAARSSLRANAGLQSSASG